ncbi:hypothetical protein SAMN04488127_1555 [Bhargavaea ginsengi]|uniref:Uncharacterized protein n=1 Tax=Bhargavaea ginsengi TaxID=426757 RepID=A0A1H6XM43_9BACL|nr:hypothetical protein [Bhargavaea ginsengi]SEJ30151.1 hypothetical protein SAMN04488127_1555 [Bhargavaea ginsengi]
MNNNRLIGLFVSFLVILNGLFIGLELYKEAIRNQWASNQLKANVAYMELNTLNNWTVYIEFALSIYIITVAVWLMIKNQEFLKKILIVSALTQVVFLIVGWLLALYIDTAVFNLTQQLLGPSFIVGVLVVYQIIRHTWLNARTYQKVN